MIQIGIKCSFALDHYNITETRSVIMIGDREHDVIGARTCEIKSIGVLYGYGNKQELEDAGADYKSSEWIYLQGNDTGFIYKGTRSRSDIGNRSWKIGRSRNS